MELFFHNKLENLQMKNPIRFPGRCRVHFTEPSGNEFAS
jgi:hypothetical protein